ncbi:MAG: hypothetical protein JKX70_10025 [Phycisphaerales bacterium]|nr:hypothetical protein [Phycisphaerales bacterium]
MNGMVANYIWLVCHANAKLAGSKLASNALESDLFEHCLQQQFVRYRNKHSTDNDGELVSDSPVGWIEYLSMSGSKGVRLVWATREEGLPNHVSAAFAGGGGQWSIETVMDDQSSVYWTSQERFVEERKKWWEFWVNEDALPRGWDVLYEGREVVHPVMRVIPCVETQIEQCTLKLMMSLQRIAKFARENGQVFWAEGFFEKGISHLKGEIDESVDDDQYPSLAPSDMLSGKAARLLLAAQAAAVFGGMGSWNDVYYESGQHVQDQHDLLSAELYESMNASYAAVASSTYPPAAMLTAKP